jgi:hypothetical protein
MNFVSGMCIRFRGVAAGFSIVNIFEFIAFKRVLGLSADACFWQLVEPAEVSLQRKVFVSGPTYQRMLPLSDCHDGGQKMKNRFVNSEFSKKLAACLSTFSPGCKQAARLQSQALIQPLSWPDRFGLRLHLFICAWCRRFGEQVRFLHSTTHQCPENEQVNALPGLTAQGRDRIKRAMQATEK